jgi:hypothetical protein
LNSRSSTGALILARLQLFPRRWATDWGSVRQRFSGAKGCT